MLPTDILKEDHQVILRMCRVLGNISRELEGGAELPPELMNDVVDFIRQFADSCHHGKEEELLYPRAGERGIPTEGGPIAVMLIEHDHGRAFTKGMAAAAEAYAAGDSEAKLAFAGHARGYADLLSQHIDKEDNILYPMCDEVLSAGDQQELLALFERVERERMGDDKHQHYVNLVDQLEKQHVA